MDPRYNIIDCTVEEANWLYGVMEEEYESGPTDVRYMVVEYTCGFSSQLICMN